MGELLAECSTAERRQAAEKSLARLRRTFSESLEATASDLTALAETDLSDRETVDAIQRVAHRLSGSASIFGFPAVSTKARDLDETCTTSRCDPKRIRSLADDLAREIAGSRNIQATTGGKS